MHQLGSIALIDICNRSAVPLFLARTTCARTRGPSVGSESPSSAGGRMGGGSRGMLSGSCPAAIPPEPPPILPPADDGDSDPTDGPRVLAQVVLAKKRGTADLLHMSISAIDPNWCIVLATGYPRFLPQLADSIHYPQLPILVRHFLFGAPSQPNGQTVAMKSNSEGCTI